MPGNVIEGQIKITAPGVQQTFRQVGTSLDELKQISKNLKAELSGLDAQMVNSKGGRALSAELRLVNTEIKALEKQAAISGEAAGNALTKGFSSIRQLAYILPGIGIAGLFNVAFEGIGALFNSLSGQSDELKDKLKGLIKPLQDIKDAAVGSTADELAKVNALTNAVLNQTLSYKERNNALDQLKQINKNYFGDLTLETAQLGALKSAVEEYTNALISQAVIKAFSDEIGKLSVELTKQQRVLDTYTKSIVSSQENLKKVVSDANDPKGIASVSSKVLDAQNALAGANRRWGDQYKIIQALKVQFNDLNKAIQDSVNESLRFKPLNSPTAKPIKQEVEFVPKLFDINQFKNLLLKTGFDKISLNIKGEVIPELHIKKTDIDKINEELRNGVKGISSNVSAEFKRVQENIDAISARMKKFNDEAKKTAETVAGTLTTSVGGFVDALISGQNPIKAFFISLGQSLVEVIKRLIQAAITSFILKSILGGASGISGLGALQGGFAGAFAGFRAAGGPVSPNKSYIVGEKGPELFVPNTGGKIVSNGSLGSSLLNGMSLRVSGEFVQRGPSLVAVINQTTRSQRRLV